MPYHKAPAEFIQYEVKKSIEKHIEDIQDIVESNILEKGDKEEDCQRLAILNALNKVQRQVNGLEKGDLYLERVKQEEKEDAVFPSMILNVMDDSCLDEHTLSFSKDEKAIQSHVINASVEVMPYIIEFIESNHDSLGVLPTECLLSGLDLISGEDIVVNKETMMRLYQVLGYVD